MSKRKSKSEKRITKIEKLITKNEKRITKNKPTSHCLKKNLSKNLLDFENLRLDPATKFVCINFSAFGINPNGKKGLLFKSDLFVQSAL